MRDILVKIALKLGVYQWLVKKINRIKFRIQARYMRRYGLEMLEKADKALSELGLQPFLTFGNLLGAYREHGFISYDPDIDLGILAKDIPDNLHEQMEKAGFRLYRQNVMATSRQVVEETYLYKKLHLDLFYYFEQGDDLYAISALKHETKEWKEANLTDGFPCERSYVPKTTFERREFLGLQIYMPVKTDEWLRAIYSDSYMTPIRKWNPREHDTRIVLTDERSYRVQCS